MQRSSSPPAPLPRRPISRQSTSEAARSESGPTKLTHVFSQQAVVSAELVDGADFQHSPLREARAGGRRRGSSGGHGSQRCATRESPVREGREPPQITVEVCVPRRLVP